MHQLITLNQMLGPHLGDPYVTPDIVTNCNLTLELVNEICLLAQGDGVELHDNPATGNAISGSGAGGLRTPDVVSVAVASQHYQGNAIDRVDVSRKLMAWCLLHQDELVKRNLFMEHPQWTWHWCHFQRVPPKSHNRWFVPYADMTKYPPTCIALVEQGPAGVPAFRVKTS